MNSFKEEDLTKEFDVLFDDLPDDLFPNRAESILSRVPGSYEKYTRSMIDIMDER